MGFFVLVQNAEPRISPQLINIIIFPKMYYGFLLLLFMIILCVPSYVYLVQYILNSIYT